MATAVSSKRKRPLEATAAQLGEQIWAGKVPIVLPSQQKPEAEAEEEDDLETAVAPDAIFPSRGVDVDGVYKTEVTAATARQALRDIRLLMHDDRLIAAATLLQKLEAFLAQARSSSSSDPEDPLAQELEARMARPKLQAALGVLRERAVECREAAEDLSSDEGWTLAVRSMGFATYIRPLGGQWYVKVEGQQEGTSVFDQLAVVREAGLYQRWGPFVCSSAMVHKFSHLDLICHFEIKAPLLHRDGLVRGYACDYSEEDMVLICGDVAEPDDYPDCGLPPDPVGFWFFGRLQIRKFRCQVQMWGVDRGKVTVAAIIDPRISLPQTVVSFAIKHIIAVLLYLIIRTARRVGEEGSRPGTLGHDIVEVIRKDPYYAAHCLPRILWYCQRKGWAWSGHAALPAVPPASELEALALAGVDVAAVLEEPVEEVEVPRGDSEASSSASTNSLTTCWLEQDQDQGEELAVKEQQPAGVVAAARASLPSPQRKQKRFLRRFFPRRKHKHHQNKAVLVQVPVETERRASAAAMPVAAGGGGGGGGVGGDMGAVAKAQQLLPHEQHGAQALAIPAARQRSSIPSIPSAHHAQPTAQQATATPPPPSPSPSASPAPSPVTRGEAAAALWGLLGTPPIPVLALGYPLVRALVAPVVRAYAGAGGEAVIQAVLLQQATALLARHGWLPASAAGTWEVTLRFHLSHLVLCGSLVLAAAALAGAALQTQGWAASWLDREAVEAWDRRAGARVRAANTGLFLLLLGVVIVGHRREVRELLLGGGRRGERK